MCVVVKNGHYCSLLEVTDRSRSTTSVTRLLQELEIKRVVSSDDLNLLNQVIFLSTLDSDALQDRCTVEKWQDLMYNTHRRHSTTMNIW